MHIAIIQDYLRNGGTERQTLFLAEFFQRLGWRVDIVVFRPGGRLEREAEARGLAVQVLQRFDTGIAFYAPRLNRTVRELGPEIVLCMGRTANCYSGLLQRIFPDTTVVGTVRTGKMLFPLHAWSLPRVRAVLVNSSWWKRRLVKKGYSSRRIHVVRNSMLLESNEAERAAWRREWREREGVEPDECVFLNVATFRPGKRHADLLERFAAFSRIAKGRPWRLWLVGEGSELRRCRDRCAVLGLSGQVRFWGYRADPRPLYSAADVAVTVSMEDSLPNFLVEAQAAGLPSVAYDYRGVRECCSPGETGLVIPAGDGEGFVVALKRILEHSRMRRRMAIKAPAFARTRFSPEPQAERIRRFLSRL